MATLHLPRLHADEHPRLSTLAHAFWALCGTIVILYIFLAALGAIDPTEAVELTVVVLALAALWLAHAWRGLWEQERREG
jgi:TRAP-type C4-dicarboxylate transport system permease large subunit